MTYATAPVMVWELAGRPSRASLPVEDVRGVCAMCARSVDRTVAAKATIAGKSFTDPAHLRASSDRVCEACAWCCTGKGMDQIRMWTVAARTDRTLPPSNPKAVFAGEHVHFTSRADMRAVVDLLAHGAAGAWVVSVAESGQKHTLPYAVLNRGTGRWRVRMDALDVDGTPGDFRVVFGHACRLREAGHSAASIEALAPSIAALATQSSVDTWIHHATPLAPWRMSPLMHLAVFLVNKERLHGYLDTYGPDRPGDTVSGRDAGLGGRGDDRPEELVEPGPHSAGDWSSDGYRLF